MKNLLVCTDGSNYAQECCRYGAWFAKKMHANIDVLFSKYGFNLVLRFIQQGIFESFSINPSLDMLYYIIGSCPSSPFESSSGSNVYAFLTC